MTSASIDKLFTINFEVMKLFLFVMLFVSGMFSDSTQICKIDLDKDFFLLGTLDEYLGRRIREPKDVFVDAYYPHEGFVVRVLDSLFKTEYPDLKCNVEPSGHMNLYSKELAYKVNEYFGIEGEKAEKDSFTGAKLNKDVFKTDKQRYSYLAGVFLRYGTILKDDFKIRFANAGGKVEICKMLFEELKCTGVEFEHLKAIPASNTFSFTPKGKLEVYLLYAVMLRGNLAQRYEEWGSMPFVKQVK